MSSDAKEPSPDVGATPDAPHTTEPDLSLSGHPNGSGAATGLQRSPGTDRGPGPISGGDHAAREREDVDLQTGRPKRVAAGVGGVVHGLAPVLRDAGPLRGGRALTLLNQHGGFDCPGCAWPEPGKPHTAEFCENGAKAVAEETTRHRADPDFFARHPISEMARETDYWLGRQGRLTHPVLREEGSDHYVPIDWDDAFAMVGDALRASTPDRSVFYTSGRTSNEAAFVYQLMARRLGTNNLPDCSNMCHESSGVALTDSIGIGKGSVSLVDITDHADLIVVVGQNPGTNHPRMLTALETAKRRGARIVTINPLPEAGMIAFKNPQKPRGVVGSGTPLTDLFLQVRLAGDMALFQAVNARLVERDALDHAFLEEYTSGLEEARAGWAALDRDTVDAATGLSAEQIEAFVDMVVDSERVIVCWAMGLTQHKSSVPTIQEVVNFLLLRGNIGRPGAGACPVRGHSNVQGDRTMGIAERPPAAFLDALDREFGFASPREEGHDTVETIAAMRDGLVDVFMAVGGNFAAATPDSASTMAAMAEVPLTVHVSTKLNRSHVVPGRRSLILPCLGRTERDEQASGPQVVTVEDSMSVVHTSRGTLTPASPFLMSEVAIICRIAHAFFGPTDDVPWEGFTADYRTIRDRISRVVGGFDDFEARVSQPGGFVLPHPPRDQRQFLTETGRAQLARNPLQVVDVPPGRLLLQTIRSHDQFNTTIYGLDDRYRGVKGGRRVVFVHPDDLAERGLADGDSLDLVGEWHDGERRATAFRAIAYPTARGCVAAYFPETNVLIPLDHTADRSRTPAAKSIVIRLEPSTPV